MILDFLVFVSNSFGFVFCINPSSIFRRILYEMVEDKGLLYNIRDPGVETCSRLKLF